MGEMANTNKFPMTVINIEQYNAAEEVDSPTTPSTKIEVMTEETVLLAEDNKVNQLIIKTMLSKLKYKVDIANNGAEAVEFMQLKNYSIVFMDIEMPILSKYRPHFIKYSLRRT